MKFDVHGLDVSRWDRLHVHVGADARSVAGLSVRILFGTPLKGTHCGALLADSTVWYEDTVSDLQGNCVIFVPECDNNV